MQKSSSKYVDDNLSYSEALSIFYLFIVVLSYFIYDMGEIKSYHMIQWTFRTIIM